MKLEERDFRCPGQSEESLEVEPKLDCLTD